MVRFLWFIEIPLLHSSFFFNVIRYGFCKSFHCHDKNGNWIGQRRVIYV